MQVKPKTNETKIMFHKNLLNSYHYLTQFVEWQASNQQLSKKRQQIKLLLWQYCKSCNRGNTPNLLPSPQPCPFQRPLVQRNRFQGNQKIQIECRKQCNCSDIMVWHGHPIRGTIYCIPIIRKLNSSNLWYNLLHSHHTQVEFIQSMVQFIVFSSS